MHSKTSPTNGISVDVEDYYHVEAFRRQITFEDWDKLPSRVVRNTQRTLKLFARNKCRGTFFVLGWVAEKFPAVVREIADSGHEVGCHSYAHRQVSRLTPDEFRQDLRRAKAAIEQATGKPCIGFRAPTFSIVKSSLWALEILHEEGFLYDSSIFPIRHDLYGYPDAPRFTHRHATQDGCGIVEVPMTTVTLGSANLPVGGGGYLRLLPMKYTKWAINRANAQGHPVIVYFHPWEIDPEQPRIDGPLKSRLRHYTGLRSMETKLDTLMQMYSFVPMKDLPAVRELLRHPSALT